MMIEEDGDEIFIPIKSVRCCESKLRPINGFWRCPKCNVSYGPVGRVEIPKRVEPDAPPRPWYEWT